MVLSTLASSSMIVGWLPALTAGGEKQREISLLPGLITATSTPFFNNVKM